MLDGTHAGSSACPDENVLAAYIDGRLATDARQVVDAHLLACDDCCEVSTETILVDEEVRQHRFVTSATMAAIVALLALAASLVFFLMR